MIDTEIGPVLVGLRTLEWRWDRLLDVGVDPGEMLSELADRTSGIAKLANDCGELNIADHADALRELVVSIADCDSPEARREALGTAVLVAADLHHSAEIAARRD